jgi:hypothetical protein
VRIGIPRYLIVGTAAIFSVYIIILGIYSISIPSNPVPVVVAMVLYFVATTISLLPWGPPRMPLWMAALNLGVAISISVLVSSVLDRTHNNGYATWHVAAVGTLMTITSTRRRHSFAWVGVAFLIVQTIVWFGPGALAAIGVIGSTVWVAVSHILSRGMTKAAKDAQRFALAEREATDWQAMQEAHVYERQLRLGQTSSMAVAMLTAVQASHGDLTDEQRRECLHLEGAIRDEIRGRKLLNDAVREEVMIARRRGTTVTLLDEGGIDELSDEELERVLNQLAKAIGSTSADKVIARTVPEGSDIAVTVVGLNSVDDGNASALGQEALVEDEVDLWLEIPRTLA